MGYREIKNLSEGEVGEMVSLTCVVVAASAAKTKKGDDYARLTMLDGESEFGGVWWDFSLDIHQLPLPNSIVDVSGQVGEYAGSKQLTVRAVRANTSGAILADFAPDSGYDIAETYEEARALANEIQNDTFRGFCNEMLTVYRSKWLSVPAAVKNHHAFAGGNLVHSLSVAKLAKAAALHYEANVDLCIAGGLMHDLGKLSIYDLDGILPVYDPLGGLEEHLVIGWKECMQYAEKNCTTDESVLQMRLLGHIILSHHGVKEYGSPVFPAFVEAHIVSEADKLDSVVAAVKEGSSKTTDDLTSRIWPANNSEQFTGSFIDKSMGEAHGDI